MTQETRCATPAIGRPLCVVAIVLAVGGASHAQSTWVRYGPTGLLHYEMDSRGDRIMDYSSAGYRGGEAIPDVSQLIDNSRVVSISPSAGDNRAQIQAAIDQVSSFSLNSNGFRGIVDLGPGEYAVSDTLNIDASGVIIRGAGDGASPASNTIIRSTATSGIDVFFVNSPSHNFHGLNSVGPRVAIIDKVVPAGASSFRVSNAGAFQVGDAVNVYRDSKQEWLDTLTPPEPWDASDTRFDHQQERRVVRIEGDRLFLDVPLAHSIDVRESTGTVYRYTDRRVENVGFQGLRGVSDFDASETQIVEDTLQFVDEDHANNFIVFGRAKNGWATEITGQHFINATVAVGSVSRSITVSESHSLDPVSLVTSSRRYSFNFNGGQYLLGHDLTVDQGRHAFVNNTTFGGFNRGPNVFLNSTATNSFSDTGPHQKYATGGLYDNVSDDRAINARYTIGGNHGFTSANFVFWNNTSESFQVLNPPGARNYLIGAIGSTEKSTTGTLDSIGTRVTFNDPENPGDSLYIAQRLEKERFSDLERRAYVVGDFDEFEFDGLSSQDLVYVDPDWLAAIDNLSSGFHSGQPVTTFDDDSIDHRVPFSFTYELAPLEEVVGATLTIATKRFGSHSDNDRLWLDSTSNPIVFNSAEDWGPMYDGDLQVLTLELVGDLEYLQDGLLNAVVSDDRAVDWAQLELIVGPSAASMGDYNRDGVVNMADFTVWRDTLNSTILLAADGNGDGVVGVEDYEVWSQQFQASAAAAPLAIPEPSSCCGVMTAVLFSVTLRLRGSRRPR
ncbi:MAG: hypothetical protein AAGJ46_08515 [Planctomycetota bacterium]